jgi:LmbE family N-acetylglucosaminyl deacetylase
MENPEHTPSRVLAIMAHPDDPEFTSGGTIAAWHRQGAWVGYVICTGGDKGSEDPTIPAADLIRTREEEQRRAGRRLGVEAFEFLGHEDGALTHTQELRRQIAAAIRRHRPDTVICFDPLSRYGAENIQHTDHYLSGEATLAAVYPAARDPRMYPELLREGLEPHKVQHVFMVGSSNPSRWVDISATIDDKIAAMLEHTSQVRDPERIKSLFPTMARAAGTAARPDPLGMAEAFAYVHLSRCERYACAVSGRRAEQLP